MSGTCITTKKQIKPTSAPYTLLYNIFFLRPARRPSHCDAYNARAYNARAYNGRIHNARIHNARAGNGRACNSRACNSRAATARTAFFA